MSSYVLWNNKGGVGKSTLTFQLATAYARQNPDVATYVLDLSPQCDVSRMLLGGGHHGGEAAILSIMQGAPRQTVQGYLNACLNDVPTGNGWPNPAAYIVDPNAHRSPRAIRLPANLSLLCGDFDLERTVQFMGLLPQPPPRGGRAPAGPHYSAHLLTRSFVRAFVSILEQQGDACFFIDTDPYYNIITTHLGLLAADQWITAYAPGSQASQYAVYRSIEFLRDPHSGLAADLQREMMFYPQPWFDNRGNPLVVPALTVPPLSVLLSNMTTPYSGHGSPPYSTPQLLHRQTIAHVQAEVTRLCGNPPAHMLHIWDFQRLGLICDFNGIDLLSLQLGSSYPQPNAPSNYRLLTTGGTPIQLPAYQANLTNVASLL